MNFLCVASNMNIDRDWPLFNLHEKYWKLSQEIFNDELFFLDDKYILNVVKMIQLPEDAKLKVVEAACWIRGNEILKRIIWHSYYILYILNDIPVELIKDWQLAKGYDEKLDDFICLFMVFAGIPKMKEIYFKLRIPDEILFDTLDYIKIWTEEYRKKHGRWGFDNFIWYYNHQQKGNLFRIGRLEFEITKFRYDIKAYRNKKDRSLVAFWAEKIKYRSDGQIDGTNGIYENLPKETLFEETDYSVKGNPVNPLGYIEDYHKTILKSDWKLILKKDDPVLSIHIPGNRKLDTESVNNSYREALIFFKKYFSDISFRAFYCGTWFLDPQFRGLLGERSNIVSFQMPFYLFPIQTDDNGVFHWVFGKKPDNIDELPQSTFLHKVIIDHYRAGNKLRTSTGFIPLDNNIVQNFYS